MRAVRSCQRRSACPRSGRRRPGGARRWVKAKEACPRSGGSDATRYATHLEACAQCLVLWVLDLRARWLDQRAVQDLSSSSLISFSFILIRTRLSCMHSFVPAFLACNQERVASHPPHSACSSLQHSLHTGSPHEETMNCKHACTQACAVCRWWASTMVSAPG